MKNLSAEQLMNLGGTTKTENLKENIRWFLEEAGFSDIYLVFINNLIYGN